VLRECLSILEKKQVNEWGSFHARSLLGGSLAGQGRNEEAKSLLLSGYEGMKARRSLIPAGDKVCLTEAAARIIRHYGNLGQPDKAIAMIGSEDFDALMPNGAAAFAR